MSRESKYIKKIMGWRLNAKAHEARQHITLENFDSDPDRAGENSAHLRNPGWLRKTSIHTFLINTFLTLVYILVINQLDINLTILLAGFFVYLFFIIFYWKAQMKKYDALVKQPIINYSDKEKLYNVFAYVLLTFIFILYFDSQEIALQAMFSFVGGLVAGMWFSYFQLIYWERKNHKVIYFDKNYGRKKSYIVLERK